MFLPLIGHFHQGFQLSGLLQHEQWFNHSPGTERERWKKEVILAARGKRFFTLDVLSLSPVM